MANTSYKYLVRTGLVNISTANKNLDGTGSLGTVITGSVASGTTAGGTIVRSVTIKATQATTQGMIRFFVGNQQAKRLIREIVVSPRTPSAILTSYGTTFRLPITLQNGETLYVSTDKAESFNIFADCVDFGCCQCSSSISYGDNISYSSENGGTNISVANPNLNGTGSLGLVLTAGTGNTSNVGSIIKSIIVKATQDITQGMIRLFINNGLTNFLVGEIPVSESTTSGGLFPSYSAGIAGFNLQSGYMLYASTENAESFNVISEGTLFDCCAC